MNIGDLINDFADNMVNNNFVYKISSNPLYFAFAIIVIIFLIITFVFRNTEIDCYYSTMLRAAVYLFLFISIMIFIHDKIISGKNLTDINGQGELNNTNSMVYNKLNNNLSQYQNSMPIQSNNQMNNMNMANTINTMNMANNMNMPNPINIPIDSNQQYNNYSGSNTPNTPNNFSGSYNILNN